MSPRRLALYALTVCLLAVVAAVVSFTKGNWLGIAWIMVAGVSSNMAIYYGKKAKAQRTA
ncbi:hypothetical protein [Streptomyces sp. NBC_01803]|uniref:hypothetical protein n=1 Tax=Streptomyces sp. NBC_01803 TaxID=2975946 RepID=UPI002DDAE582|nr:hypothetical protein [Streptomyces sp. NBC_01803]WSA46536.1 hypothetical protein OIE51_21520 [Streptomyces sp. NBC_01803]